MRPSTRLRTRLVLMALVITIPALVLLFYDQSVERARSRQNAIDDTLRLARLVASEEGTLIESVQRFLLTLAEFPGLRERDPSACDEVLPNLYRVHPPFINIWVVNADATSFCSARQVTTTIEARRQRAWFQQALAQRTTVVGDFQMSVTT